MTKEEFVEQAYAAALRSSEHSGMPALVTVAQAALESNWGQSRLSQEANNYFGIKAHAPHERIAMSTKECEHGCSVMVTAEFAKYASLEECVECRDRILMRGASYAAVRRTPGDEEGFVREMAKHWATDPKYAEKLEVMLAEVKAMVHSLPPSTSAL
jgi:flagellum-specific peptidoglycan hydrolase FlgJ